MSKIHVDQYALAEFACRIRPDWDRDAVLGAITAAGRNRPENRSHEAHFARLVATAAAMLGDEESTPRDLLRVVCRPAERTPPPDPDAVDRAASAARAELARVLIERDLAQDGAA